MPHILAGFCVRGLAYAGYGVGRLYYGSGRLCFRFELGFASGSRFCLGLDNAGSFVLLVYCEYQVLTCFRFLMFFGQSFGSRQVLLGHCLASGSLRLLQVVVV